MNDPANVPHPQGTSRVRIDLGYDGTDFSGWASQPNLRTVQGEIEAALGVILRAEAVRLTVAGRTDAGVHARHQVAHLDLTIEQYEKWGSSRPKPGQDPLDVDELRARRLRGALRRSAPDVTIHSVTDVPDVFDARFSALRRRYEYRVLGEGMRQDPLAARYTAQLTQPLDLDAMQRASDELLGLNDFTTFCKAREGATAVRDLLSFEWAQAPDGAYAARIEADAFCHSMVRALVGAVVAVGSGRINHDELIALRDARARTSKFPVMPAHGLSLQEVTYPAPAELLTRAEQTRARRRPLDPDPSLGK